MIYSSVYYDACTEQSTSGWCATSAYENTQGYYSYKYCTDSDWTTSSDSDGDSSDSDATASASSGQTTTTGEYCVPMTYRLALFLSICHGKENNYIMYISAECLMCTVPTIRLVHG